MAEKNTISQRISLEGAEEIKRLLDGIGKAGEGAFLKLKLAADASGSKIGTAFTASLANLRTEYAAFEAATLRVHKATANLDERFTQFTQSLRTVAERVGIVTGAIAGAAGAIFELAKSAGDDSQHIANQAAALGLSTDAYQKLREAAQASGVEQGVFDKLLLKFNLTSDDTEKKTKKSAKATKEHTQASKELSKALEEVSVSGDDGAKHLVTIVRGAKGIEESLKGVGKAAKDEEQGLIEYAKRVDKISDAHTRLEELAKRFGPKMAALVAPLIHEIAVQFDESARAAEHLLPVLSKAEIALGVELHRELDNVGINLTLMRERLSLLFAPDIIEGAKAFNKLIDDNQKAIKDFGTAVKDHAIDLVKDFIAILQGRDDDVKNTWILTARDAVVSFGTTVKSVFYDRIVPAFEYLKGKADGLATLINRVFGTQLTGSTLLGGAAILYLSGTFGVVVTSINLFLAGANLSIAAFRAIRISATLTAVGLRLLGRAAATAFVGAAEGAGLTLLGFTGVGLAAAAAAFLIYTNWNGVKAASRSLWQELKSGAVGAAADIGNAFKSFGLTIKDLIAGNGTAAFADFKDGALAQMDILKTILRLDVAVLNVILAAFGVDGPALWARLGTAWAAFTDYLITKAKEAGAYIGLQFGPDFFAVFVNGAVALFNRLWDGIKSAGLSAFTYLKDTALSALDAIGSAISKVISLFGSVGASISNLGGSGETSGDTSPPQAFAGGGAVSGPGTATSDSIPAWLSDGEFVIRAAAVKKFGARFFALLNGLEMPQGGLKFNMGGLVDGFAPRFASGGLVEAIAAPAIGPGVGRNPVVINIDRQSFAMTAEDETIARLTRAANKGTLASNGRKPAWYKG